MGEDNESLSFFRILSKEKSDDLNFCSSKMSDKRIDISCPVLKS